MRCVLSRRIGKKGLTKMESVQFHPIDFRLEAAAALTRLACRGDNPRGGDMQVAVEYYCKKYDLDRSRFSGLTEAYDFFKAHMVCDETELLTLFGYPDGFETNLYDLLAQLDFNLGKERIHDLNLRIALFLSDENDEPVFDHAGVPDLLAYAQRMPVSDGVKWLFSDAVVRYEEYRSRIDRMLNQAEILIREKAYLLEPYAQQKLAGWVALPNEEAFFDRLAAEGISLDCRRADVYPMVMQFTTISVHSNVIFAEHFGAEERSIITYGVLLDEISRSERTGKTDLESIYNLLHALDDKKRLQILSALKERSLYGQELAGLTELSPGTVSHHMGELVGVGLVTIEKQGVKMLYSIHEKRLKELFTLLEKNLIRP